jgi:hypothetical protein
VATPKTQIEQKLERIEKAIKAIAWHLDSQTPGLTLHLHENVEAILNGTEVSEC